MRFDCHMHTHLCGHAHGRPEEYVHKAQERGINLITFTCHIPMEGNGFLQEGIRMNRSELSYYKVLVKRAQETGESLGIQVLYGIEAEVFPEDERLASMKELLKEESFDFILGSLHHQLPVYRRWLNKHRMRSDREIIHAYFQHLGDGAASGCYHSMSHPDLIRIYGTVDWFEPADHEAIIKKFLETLVENKVCMEVNTSGLSKGVYEVHPDPLILRWAQALGVHLTLGSDSHRPEQIGQHFPNVLQLLDNIGFSSLSYFKQGYRIEVPMNEILTEHQGNR
ncbi:MAG: histidinol-phosphatase [Verrucomicrobia bacterium]|nr:histidinol-phosphatase [Verrucomicrobiota bacterium]